MRFTAVFPAVFLVAGCVGPSADLTRSGMVPLARSGVPAAATDAASRCPKYGKGSGILSDGDFDGANDPGASYLTFYKGQRLAPHWKVTKLDVNLIGTKFWNFDGLCSVDLDGESAVGGIAHTAFSVKKGSPYALSFLMSGNSYCGPTVKKMQVTVAGHSVIFRWNVSNGHDAEHGIVGGRSLKFTAHSSISGLSFTSLDTPGSGCGPVIGAIAVSPR